VAFPIGKRAFLCGTKSRSKMGLTERKAYFRLGLRSWVNVAERSVMKVNFMLTVMKRSEAK